MHSSALVSIDSNQLNIHSDPEARDTALQALALSGITNPHTYRAYERAIRDILIDWHNKNEPPLTKFFVQSHLLHLHKTGVGPTSIEQRLTAIKRLVREGADNQLIPEDLVAGIERISVKKQKGQRIGHWLTLEQFQELLEAPDTSKLKGKRDKALLATLGGAGLRRTEGSILKFTHFQIREGRWVITDLLGKGNKFRSIPIANGVYDTIHNWEKAAGLKDGLVFRAISRSDRIIRDSLKPDSINYIVNQYAEQCGFTLAAHDLRRTFSKLAHKAGAPIEQIQKSLGHASIVTTERYLGVDQDFQNAPSDYIEITFS